MDSENLVCFGFLGFGKDKCVDCELGVSLQFAVRCRRSSRGCCLRCGSLMTGRRVRPLFHFTILLNLERVEILVFLLIFEGKKLLSHVRVLVRKWCFINILYIQVLWSLGI